MMGIEGKRGKGGLRWCGCLLERSLVDHVLEVGAGEAGGAARQHVQLQVGRGAHAAHVQLQDLAPPAVVRRRHRHLSDTPSHITFITLLPTTHRPHGSHYAVLI